MNSLAGEGIEIDRQGGDERLALAGLHFRDAALVKHHPADQLHIEMPLPEGALGCFADRGESRGQKFVQPGTLGGPGAQVGRARLQLPVAQSGKLGFEGIDGRDAVSILTDFAIVGSAEDFGGKRPEAQHSITLSWDAARGCGEDHIIVSGC